MGRYSYQDVGYGCLYGDCHDEPYAFDYESFEL